MSSYHQSLSGSLFEVVGAHEHFLARDALMIELASVVKDEESNLVVTSHARTIQRLVL